jgi:hypothetical protein
MTRTARNLIHGNRPSVYYGAVSTVSLCRAPQVPVKISLLINGRSRTVVVEPRTNLLDMLREQVHRTGKEPSWPPFYHATGRRIRDLPISAEHLISENPTSDA